MSVSIYLYTDADAQQEKLKGWSPGACTETYNYTCTVSARLCVYLYICISVSVYLYIDTDRQQEKPWIRFQEHTPNLRLNHKHHRVNPDLNHNHHQTQKTNTATTTTTTDNRDMILIILVVLKMYTVRVQ